MPLFRTTNDILRTNSEELHDENHKNFSFITLPPNPLWDNSRELNIEDVDIWEVIFEGGGGVGLYASWCPYANFFMLRYKEQLECYYGVEGERRLENRLNDLKLPYPKE